MPTPTHERLTTVAKQSAFMTYFSTMLSEEALETTNLWTASIFLFLMTAVARGFFSIRDYIYAKNKNLSGLSRVLFNGLVGTAALSLMGIFIIAPMQGWNLLYYTILGINGLFAVEAVLNGLGSIYHLVLAIQAPANSIERKTQLQAAFGNLNKALIAATVLTLLIVPFNPPVAFALTCGFVAYLGVNVVWHAVPKFRQLVKSFLHLTAPVDDMSLSTQPTLTQAIQDENRTDADKQRESKYHASLFGGRAYRKKIVYDYLKDAQVGKARAYLKDECSLKLNHYLQLSSLNPRQVAKQTVIRDALLLLDNASASVEDVQALIDQNQKVHQSFFAETADTIDLLDGIRLFLREVKSFKSPENHIELDFSNISAYCA